MKNLYDITMDKLRRAIDESGSIRSLAEKLDMNPSTMSRWFAEDRSPEFRGLASIFEYLGVQIVFPYESIKESDIAPNKEFLEKIKKIEQENSYLKKEILRKEGAIDLLKEQLAEAQKEKRERENQESSPLSFSSQKKKEDKPA